MSGCYVLLLKDNNYYIGISRQVTVRLQSHACAAIGLPDPKYGGRAGSKWTRLHPVVKIIEIIYGKNNLAFENTKTLQYMKTYEISKVRGGRRHHPNLSHNSLIDIQSKLTSKI